MPLPWRQTPRRKLWWRMEAMEEEVKNSLPHRKMVKVVVVMSVPLRPTAITPPPLATKHHHHHHHRNKTFLPWSQTISAAVATIRINLRTECQRKNEENTRNQTIQQNNYKIVFLSENLEF